MDGSDIKRYGDRAKETARLPTLRRTRFVCVSDTHNHAVKLPKGDVLIHAGDLTNQGTSSELIKAVQWLEKADFEAKIVVAGNHDITLDADFYKEYGIYFHNQRPESPSECLDLLESSPSIIYLAHSAVKIRLGSPSGPHTEFTVFGSPYSPRDGLWAFSYPRSVPQPIYPAGPDEAQKYTARPGSRSRSKRRGSSSKSASQQRCEQRPVPPALESVPAEQQQPVPDSNPDSTGDVAAATAAQPGGGRHSNRPTEPDLPGPSAEEIWAKIPLSADVVVTHGPPRGHRDEAADRRRSAGCEALRCRLWRVRPRLVVCGHVHEGRGAEVVRWDIEGGPGSANGRFMEVHGAHRLWEDPAPAASPGAGRGGGGGARISLVDLTGDERTGRKPLDNDGGVGPSSGLCGGERDDDDREWTLVDRPTEAGSGTNRVLGDTHSMCQGATPGIGILGVGGDPEQSARCDTEALLGRMGRRETCIVNCAIMANSYPHVGGKRLNKPIVVDLDLPVWED